ncbi:MAG: hypothetical protein EHM88_05855 [Candidatus Rokuibacteriota bacterium]|nr:MAG: hypothetical protein EHM88_05855 [Candidatus Rokubacteria bacterium]
MPSEPRADAFTVTGGAQLGWINASWPFGKLSVSSGLLTISSPFSRAYVFEPEQVMALEPCGWIPILQRGVRIVHANPRYPSRIVFVGFQSPERLIERMHQAGFVPALPDTRLPRRPGLPIRGSAVLVLVAACAILFLLSRGPDGGPGPSMLLALALLYAAASALPRSRWLQSWMLNPGRSVDEIRLPLQLLRLASGLVLALLVAAAVLGAGA